MTMCMMVMSEWLADWRRTHSSRSGRRARARDEDVAGLTMTCLADPLTSVKPRPATG
jgi:hypothetical protein